jgi:GNAT superfamily N-acetyltransferase
LQANVDRNVDWWLAHPDAAVHLQAVEGDRLVGVVLVKQFWNLCSLFVDPACQGRGVGRALLEAAIEECRGRSPRDALWLNAAPGAIGFYRRLGFVVRTPTKALPPGFAALQRPL